MLDSPDILQQRLNVSRETLARIEAYRQLLLRESAVHNLVGPSVAAQFWGRHALDSAQLLHHAPSIHRWLDIGAGAGFPGLILAILLCDTPGAHVCMLDSNSKKVRFLSLVARELGLPATVHYGRAEALPTPDVDAVTARACAPMQRLLGYVAPHVQSGIPAFLFKGQNAATELTQAAKSWTFNHELLPSLSDSDGCIVRLTALRAKTTKRQ